MSFSQQISLHSPKSQALEDSYRTRLESPVVREYSAERSESKKLRIVGEAALVGLESSVKNEC